MATQVSLADGSVLQVTEQRFVTPAGAQIDGVGVTPDVVVDMTDEDLQNDRDPQLGGCGGTPQGDASTHATAPSRSGAMMFARLHP